MKILFLKSWYIRCTILILLLFPVAVSAAQGTIVIKGQAVTMKQAIAMIEKASGYTFFFKASDIDNTSKKNINCRGTIDEVLREVFKGSDVDYVVKDKEILLKTNKTAPTKVQQAKKRTITGIIIGADDKEPIIGANVWLKNSSSGAITDVNGKYTIHIEGVGGVLEFSYIGYKKKEVAIGEGRELNVTLDPDTEVLDEVVVVGYGSQRKESVVGAISTLDVGKLTIPGSSISTLST